MCIGEECNDYRDDSGQLSVQKLGVYPGVAYFRDDRDFYGTQFADLFYSTPPLSGHQMNAVNSLNHLATDDFPHGRVGKGTCHVGR
jgi:hypothetical protein